MKNDGFTRCQHDMQAKTASLLLTKSPYHSTYSCKGEPYSAKFHGKWLHCIHITKPCHATEITLLRCDFSGFFIAHYGFSCKRSRYILDRHCERGARGGPFSVSFLSCSLAGTDSHGRIRSLGTTLIPLSFCTEIRDKPL